jgi:hypothetical protein
MTDRERLLESEVAWLQYGLERTKLALRERKSVINDVVETGEEKESGDEDKSEAGDEKESGDEDEC